jgi:glyoxalase family protein
MRLVKKTVNQDMPETYHLFYADRNGTPGTDLTFFPWPLTRPTRPGAGLAMEIAFAIPPGTSDWWEERLVSNGVRIGPRETRFGDAVLPFKDPDGLPMVLIETAAERAFVPWEESPVPTEQQIRGFHSVRLWERSLEPTETLLVSHMGFSLTGVEGEWHRFTLRDGDGAPGTMVDVRAFPSERMGEWGTGGVHHVAWRVKDSEEQMALRDVIAGAGLHPTPQIDRFWFQSVYFREPGGVLFELATDGPGMDRDESREHLGERLILPPKLEPLREQIEAVLPPL